MNDKGPLTRISQNLLRGTTKSTQKGMCDRTDEFLRAVNVFRPPNVPNQQYRRPDPSAFTVGAKRVSFSLGDIEKLVTSLNKLCV